MKKTSPEGTFADLRNQTQALFMLPSERESGKTPEEIWGLMDELETYQIELELQNNELRLVQEELAQSRNRYCDLYDFAPAGYLTISPDGTVVEANVTAATMLGVERQFLIGNYFSWFIANEDQDSYYHNHRKIVETQEPQNCELLLKKHGGGLVHILLKSILDQGLEGELGQIRVMITDISERKELEAELRKSSEKIKNFTYAIVHDIKNPAVALHELCSRLHDQCRDKLNKQCSNYCDRIIKNSEHIAGLVDKINMYALTKEKPLPIEKIN